MGKRGFTLMEVLAAIVLMAIVFPVAMHAISLSTSLANNARRKAEAAVLARSKLNELIVLKSWQNGALNGSFDEPYAGFTWVAEIRDWDSSSIRELDLKVTWIAGNREQNVLLATLIDVESN
ncbi:MAG TPA: type II secretion system protein [Planctomycetota bacterium]